MQYKIPKIGCDQENECSRTIFGEKWWVTWGHMVHVNPHFSMHLHTKVNHVLCGCEKKHVEIV